MPTTVTKLTCSPASVARGSSSTCSVTGAPTGTTFSNWKFTDSNNNTVTSSQNNSSWSGVMVTNGTISVTLTTGGGSTPLSASITVTNRTGSAWTFNPASASQESNGFTCPGSSIVLAVPSPPSLSYGDTNGATGDLGAFCVTDGTSFNGSQIADQGPNNGYWYLTSVSPGQPNQTWGYYYVISPDLQNSSSTFSLAQCGNYNAQTNPNGFINQSNLLANTTRHESGLSASHYSQYIAATNVQTNNPGTVAEQQVGAPSLSSAQFTTNVTNALQPALSNINSATKSPEPPDCSHNASNTFQGYTNFSPYASCN